ncbi:hypothetical protein FLONG3_7661 [Fusarium longipes]|uniref:Uncharacterized protein n=1 Tax=Fusarium longipes TaxID=694270 RepID=A0A395SC38_9HYPO|nr:hypothetical protein FLONG3_7661 [Fusarium longipes]
MGSGEHHRPSVCREFENIISRDGDEDLFLDTFGVPISYRGATHFYTSDYSRIKPGWKEVFDQFPDLHWMVRDVVEALVSGGTPTCPMHYTSAQRYTFNRVLETTRELGPKKYIRTPHPCGAIGDGRPRPRTEPSSSSSSPEERVPSSPLLAYQELVATSVADTLEEDSLVSLTPFLEKENSFSPPVPCQESVEALDGDMWNGFPTSSDSCKADRLDLCETNSSDSSTIGSDRCPSTPPSSSSLRLQPDLIHPNPYLPRSN